MARWQLSTSDGGKTWAAQNSHTTTDLYSVDFATDGLHGLAVGGQGVVSRTADGGAHWAVEHTPSSSDLYSVHLTRDGQLGWALAEKGTLLRTSDGGTTWTTLGGITDAVLEIDGLDGRQRARPLTARGLPAGSSPQLRAMFDRIDTRRLVKATRVRDLSAGERRRCCNPRSSALL